MGVFGLRGQSGTRAGLGVQGTAAHGEPILHIETGERGERERGEADCEVKKWRHPGQCKASPGIDTCKEGPKSTSPPAMVPL